MTASQAVVSGVVLGHRDGEMRMSGAPLALFSKDSLFSCPLRRHSTRFLRNRWWVFRRVFPGNSIPPSSGENEAARAVFSHWNAWSRRDAPSQRGKNCGSAPKSPWKRTKVWTEAAGNPWIQGDRSRRPRAPAASRHARYQHPAFPEGLENNPGSNPF